MSNRKLSHVHTAFQEDVGALLRSSFDGTLPKIVAFLNHPEGGFLDVHVPLPSIEHQLMRRVIDQCLLFFTDFLAAIRPSVDPSRLDIVFRTGVFTANTPSSLSERVLPLRVVIHPPRCNVEGSVRWSVGGQGFVWAHSAPHRWRSSSTRFRGSLPSAIPSLVVAMSGLASRVLTRRARCGRRRPLCRKTALRLAVVGAVSDSQAHPSVAKTQPSSLLLAVPGSMALAAEALKTGDWESVFSTAERSRGSEHRWVLVGSLDVPNASWLTVQEKSPSDDCAFRCPPTVGATAGVRWVEQAQSVDGLRSTAWLTCPPLPNLKLSAAARVWLLSESPRLPDRIVWLDVCGGTAILGRDHSLAPAGAELSVVPQVSNFECLVDVIPTAAGVGTPYTATALTVCKIVACHAARAARSSSPDDIDTGSAPAPALPLCDCTAMVHHSDSSLGRLEELLFSYLSSRSAVAPQVRRIFQKKAGRTPVSAHRIPADGADIGPSILEGPSLEFKDSSILNSTVGSTEALIQANLCAFFNNISHATSTHGPTCGACSAKGALFSGLCVHNAPDNALLPTLLSKSRNASTDVSDDGEYVIIHGGVLGGELLVGVTDRGKISSASAEAVPILTSIVRKSLKILVPALPDCAATVNSLNSFDLGFGGVEAFRTLLLGGPKVEDKSQQSHVVSVSAISRPHAVTFSLGGPAWLRYFSSTVPMPDDLVARRLTSALLQCLEPNLPDHCSSLAYYCDPLNRSTHGSNILTCLRQVAVQFQNDPPYSSYKCLCDFENTDQKRGNRICDVLPCGFFKQCTVFGEPVHEALPALAQAVIRSRKSIGREVATLSASAHKLSKRKRKHSAVPE